jgi:hypothetical protein
LQSIEAVSAANVVELLESPAVRNLMRTKPWIAEEVRVRSGSMILSRLFANGSLKKLGCAAPYALIIALIIDVRACAGLRLLIDNVPPMPELSTPASGDMETPTRCIYTVADFAAISDLIKSLGEFVEL